MSAESWAERFQALMREAEADGFELWVNNECCGCERMEIRVGRPDDPSDGGAKVTGWPS